MEIKEMENINNMNNKEINWLTDELKNEVFSLCADPNVGRKCVKELEHIYNLYKDQIVGISDKVISTMLRRPEVEHIRMPYSCPDTGSILYENPDDEDGVFLSWGHTSDELSKMTGDESTEGSYNKAILIGIRESGVTLGWSISYCASDSNNFTDADIVNKIRWMLHLEDLD